MTRKILLFLVMFLLVSSICYAATRKEAEQAILDGEKILADLIDLGEPHTYINDTLVLAKQALQRADYAEMLSNESLEGEVVAQARAALEGLNYEGFDYDAVLELTNKIKARQDDTLLLKDSISALQQEVDSMPELDLSEVKSIIDSAHTSYKEERFDDTRELLRDGNTLLSEILSESTSLKAVYNSGKYLVSKFWLTIVIVVVCLIIAVFIFLNQSKKYLLRKKYKHMQIEQHVLIKLMKKVQKQRYVDGVISEYLYKVKIDRYREKLAKIKAELPVLRRKLKKVK